MASCNTYSTPTNETTIPTQEAIKTSVETNSNTSNYLGSDDDVYRINITTHNQEFPSSKETFINGILNITEQNLKKTILKNNHIQIRLRGNSTSAPDKKPFKIKFEKKVSLFGLPEAKDWVLLANYYDKSNLRNYLAYLTANKLDNLSFQPSSIFVDLYLNEEYQGLYLLTEQIEANEGRVDIKNNVSKKGINSFLIEADVCAIDEYPGMENFCYINIHPYSFSLKYPDADDYLKALKGNDKKYVEQYTKDVVWLKKALNDISTAINSNDFDNFKQYIDVDSFIDYYLVQEFFKNVDVGSLSQYYVIDQSSNPVKLSCGPVWDFDIAAGVIDETSTDTYAGYAYTDLFVRSWDSFYSKLFQNKIFISLVENRYKEVRSVFEEVFEEIEIAKKAFDKAQIRNINRWPLTKERKTWIEVYALSRKYVWLNSLDAHYDLLIETLEERLALLDKTYLK